MKHKLKKDLTSKEMNDIFNMFDQEFSMAEVSEKYSLTINTVKLLVAIYNKESKKDNDT